MKLEEEIYKKILENDLQVSRPALNQILKKEIPLEELNTIIKKLKKTNEFIITEEHVSKERVTETTKIKVIKNYQEIPPVNEVNDIISYFSDRYEFFRKQLKTRVKDAISIKHAKSLYKEKTSIIGIVKNKRKTNKGNIILDLEDLTGEIRAIATNKEILPEAETIVNDEVIGVSGSIGTDVLFINEIIRPDLPFKREETKTKDEEYIAFLSDTHFGSKNFLKNEFNELLRWLNGESDDDSQREMVEKIKCIPIAGDLVDGVGIYPNQEKELEIKDVYKQYEAAAKYLSKIPEQIQIIIGPGNHDYVRTAQPQPPIDKEVAAPLYELNNITLVSNPTTITLTNSGVAVNLLMYHGVSIDNMVSTDPSLKGGYKHPEKVMLSLLKKRHLSPQYETGTITNAPDPLIIPDNTDILHCGHVHSNGALRYRGVTLINSGTWQAQTEFQVLCGHEPTPANLPILNLKTRALTLISFAK